MSLSTQNVESMKTVADGIAVVGTVGVLTKLLPVIASIFTIIWLGLRIWETDTIRKITGRDPKPLNDDG